MLRFARRSPRVLPLLVVLIVLAGVTNRPPARAQEPVEITIFHDTHLHGQLTGPNGVTLAHYTGVVAQQRSALANTLFLGAGDDLGPSQVSSVFKGAQMVDAFNAAGLDVDTYGNHEFDFGPDNLVEQVRASRFVWVSANVLDRRTGDVFAAEAGARRFIVKDVGGVRVGITGAAWQFLGLTNAGPNVEVLDATEALQTVVPRMREAGAQVVVVMTHLCRPESAAIAAVVSGIDVLAGDHCAEPPSEPEVVNGAIISRRGDEYRPVRQLTLRIEGGRVAGYTWRNHEVTKDSPALAAVADVIAGYQARLDVELSAPIGETTVPLDTRNETVRRKESNLGNYLADTLRAWGQADVAIMNGGGIRGNKEYPAGVLTRGDIVSILPFNNTAVLLRLSGADLRAALENGVSMLETAAGRFPQVSGLTFRFDPDAPAGSRVLAVTVAGAPLDPERTYLLATNDFMANGGDGYEVFQTAEVVIPGQAGPLLADLLIAAVQRDGTIAPKEDGRIVIGRE